MLQHYKDNLQLYIIFLLWLIIGMYGNVTIYVVMPLTMMLMRKKGLYEELLYGFFFILLLSDSLEERLFFAKNAKNIYITLLAFFVLTDLNSFRSLNKLYKIFLPFFLFSFMTTLTSVSENFFLTSVQKTASYFLVFFIVPNLVSRLYAEKGTIFLKNFILFAFTIILLGILFRYVSYDVTHIKGGRFRGLLGNPNGLGMYCVLLCIIFFIVNDFFPSLFLKWERILIYLVIFYSLFICGSRNAIFAIFMFLLYQRFFTLSPILGFTVFLLMIFVIEIINNNFDTIVLKLGLGDYFRLRTLEDGSGRYIAWRFAWKQIQENFFIGKGFGYNEYYMRQYYSILAKMGHQGGIHNSFLTFWMDQGLVGLLIYLRSYVLTFIQASKKTRFAFPIMFAISFTALFESWLVGSLSVFAFLGLMIFTIVTSDEITKGIEIEPYDQLGIKEIDQ